MIKHVDDEALEALAHEIVNELLDSLDYSDIMDALDGYDIPDTHIDDYLTVLWNMAMARISALKEVMHNV